MAVHSKPRALLRGRSKPQSPSLQGTVMAFKAGQMAYAKTDGATPNLKRIVALYRAKATTLPE